MSEGADLLFLDSNVLFSGAYREESGLVRLWQLSGAALVSSSYAIAEATRNLSTSEQHARLERLLEKDMPIMNAAVGSRSTHLITGDRKHFGHLFGRVVAGVLVTRPADHLRRA